MALPWKCPHCGKKLKRKWDGGGLYCLKNHQFDAAKEGYFHLLPANAMKTKTPGDSKEMIAARRAFLNAGYYQIFGDALAQLCASLAAQQPVAIDAPSKARAVSILDAGCGEGWYSRAIAAHFAAAQQPLCLAGFDISKDAVRLAAKALPTAQFAVASSFAQPVQNEWADIAVNIFSPMAAPEFWRVLRMGGTLIYAVPSPRHLFGLKEVLYETPYENTVEEMHYEGFRRVDAIEVTGELTVPQEMLQNLFAMTPYYWKTPRDGAQRLAACEQLTTEIGFTFLVFEKIAIEADASCESRV